MGVITQTGKTMKIENLPVLDNEYGWVEKTVVKLLEDRQCLPELFFKWMNGQTTALIDGETTYYPQDVLRYLTKGGPNARVID